MRDKFVRFSLENLIEYCTIALTMFFLAMKIYPKRDCLTEKRINREIIQKLSIRLNLAFITHKEWFSTPWEPANRSPRQLLENALKNSLITFGICNFCYNLLTWRCIAGCNMIPVMVSAPRLSVLRFCATQALLHKIWMHRNCVFIFALFDLTPLALFPQEFIQKIFYIVPLIIIVTWWPAVSCQIQLRSISRFDISV